MNTHDTKDTVTHDHHEASDNHTPRASKRQWAGLIIMVIPLFMLSTDITVLYLAMPAITADLMPVGAQSLWILHIGEFLSAATIITFGLLARRVGARRLLLGAVAVYGVASLIAAYAVNAEMLIVGRALLGIAAAAFTPAGMVLIRRAFRNPKQYNVAFAAYMAAFAGGMAAGPPFGGLILEYFWWGAVFLINVPIAAVLLFGGPFLLERNHADRQVRIDTLSVVLSIATILALVYGLQELAAGGFAGLPLASAGVGIGLLLLFIRRQRTSSNPLLELALFRNGTFRLMLILIFTAMFGMTVADMLLPQYLQLVRGMSPLQTGLLLLTPALGATAGTMLTPILAGARRKALPLAATVAIAGTVSGFLVLMLPDGSLLSIITALTLISIAGAPFMTLVSQMLISAVPEEKTGSATAVQDVTAGLGMASSLAFLGAGALVVYRRVLATQVDGEVPAEAVDAAGENFGIPTSVVRDLSLDEAALLVSAAETAFTTTTQSGYLVYAVFSVVLVSMVLLLRRFVRIG